jgi:ribonucleoside-diphosphate reductase alpha chain
MTGIMHNPKLIENKNLLQMGGLMIRNENELTAKAIGINQALRCTTIKPSGNSSTVAGCCAGIHPYHARYYIRRMRINKINPIWAEILNKLPQVCDDSDPQVGIVAFACEAPEKAILRKDIDAIEFLNKVKFFQDYWVMAGNREIESQKGLTHNVSNTCTVKSGEWDAIKDRIWDLRKSVRGISLLSDYGDTVYKNAPYETSDISDEYYKTLLGADWSLVDFSLGGYVENPQADPACAGGVCLL